MLTEPTLANPPPGAKRAAAGAAAAVLADDQPLYQAKPKIYPQRVSGTFRRIKWAVLLATLGVYYLLPFVRWDRGPGAPSQAVLVDFPARRVYVLFIEIWPQEVYYLTGLMIIAAMVLFLMNAVAGRVWCGYLCPQTVWTDLFFAVERFFEGDRRARMQRDAAPWTTDTLLRKAGKHAVWLFIAWWTGGAWVLYFADAPTLVKDLATFQAPFIAYASIGVLTFTTYTLAGHMREQVCVYMCPWPRIQAALTDEYALNVTYRRDRGEPRASVKKSAVLRDKGLPAGDCVDCNQCVAVCPTGVDIRDGASLGCIQCGLCIDACDTVMAKIGRPERLIGYDTEDNIRRRAEGLAPILKLVRVRSLLYVAIIAIAGGIMVYTLATRATLGINALHDRNPIFVQMSDGSVRNGYTVRLLNKQPQPRRLTLAVEGLPGAVLEIVGVATAAAGRQAVEIGPDQTRELRVLVTLPGRTPAAVHSIDFVVVADGDGETARAADHFRGP
jgi:cytochrome c oxidase accessory protein FixG